MVGERKERSDKKVDVKPTMSLELKSKLYQLAELCNEPVKDVGERLCVEGLKSKIIIEILCKWLRRNYYYNNTIALGHIERPRLKLKALGETGKVTIRFTKNDYDKLRDLAYALDITPSATATVLIRLTMNSVEFMENFVDGLYEGSDLEKGKTKQQLSKEKYYD